LRIWPEIRYPCWMEYILTRAPSTQKKKWKQCQWPQNLHATSYIPHTLAILRNRSNWHINKSYVTNYVTLHYNKLYTAWSTDAERTPHIYYTYNVKSKIRYTYKRMAFKVPTIYFSRNTPATSPMVFRKCLNSWRRRTLFFSSGTNLTLTHFLWTSYHVLFRPRLKFRQRQRPRRREQLKKSGQGVHAGPELSKMSIYTYGVHVLSEHLSRWFSQHLARRTTENDCFELTADCSCCCCCWTENVFSALLLTSLQAVKGIVGYATARWDLRTLTDFTVEIVWLRTEKAEKAASTCFERC